MLLHDFFYFSEKKPFPYHTFLYHDLLLKINKCTENVTIHNIYSILQSLTFYRRLNYFYISFTIRHKTYLLIYLIHSSIFPFMLMD